MSLSEKPDTLSEKPDTLSGKPDTPSGTPDTWRFCQQLRTTQLTLTGDQRRSASTDVRHDWHGNRTLIRRGSREWQYRYSKNGNLDSELPPRPSGSTEAAYTTYHWYDDLGRIETTQPALEDFDTQRRAELGIGPIHYTYDSGAGENLTGRLARVDLPWGATEYDYWVAGQVANESRTFTMAGPESQPCSSAADCTSGVCATSGFCAAGATPSITQSVARRYNAMGQFLAESHDSGESWRTSYDGRGLTDKVEWLDGAEYKSVATYSRTTAGAPWQRATDYGQYRHWAYDQLGRVTYTGVYQEIAGEYDAQPTYRWYRYTTAGNLESVVGESYFQPVSAAYTYDNRRRLVSAVGPIDYRGDFSYDDSGNILSAVIAGIDDARDVAYEYGNPAQGYDPQAVMGLRDPAAHLFAEFDYDPAGNMTYRDVGDVWYHTFDFDDKLVEVLDGNPGSSYRELYYYDHANSRVAARAVGGAEPAKLRLWFGSRETHFAGDGTEQKRTVHLSDSGGVLARVETVGTASRLEMQYADTLHNLMMSIDENGLVSSTFLYGAFGEVVDATGEADHRRQFNGKERNAKTGLGYYGYRYYDPIALRWNAGDPLFRFAPEAGGLGDPTQQNLYQFSGNNPLRFYDPDGRAAADMDISLWSDTAEKMMTANADYAAENPKMVAMVAAVIVVTVAVVAVTAVTGGTAGGAAVAVGKEIASEVASELTNGASDFVPSVGGARRKAAKAIRKRVVGGGCFVAGTLIATELGLVPIQDIRAGDEVLARDEHSGVVVAKPVAETFVRHKVPTLFVTITNDHVSETYQTTAEHPFWAVGRGWVKAADLVVGVELVSLELTDVRVTMTKSGPDATVYNFHVADLHTYHVGKSGIWVHNTSRANLPAARGVPDNAVVCRGGSCTAERFTNGSGVTTDAAGNLQGASVNAADTLEAASKGIPHKKVGVTTAGDIRAAGGTVTPSPTPRNPNHCTMGGICAETAEELFTPTVPNPSAQ